MGTFEAVQAQYEKNKNAASGSKFASQEERMKKYFTTVLPKGVTEEERRIRILPTKDGTTPFVEIYFHEILVDGKWVKLYDPKQEGKRSPLNEVHDSLKATGVESDAELAKTYRSRKFFIVKIIDRDHEQDGPKFWRFKFNSKQEGIMDKIWPVFRTRGDITDVEKGRDLILSLSLTKSGKGKDYTQISSVLDSDPSPLSKDPEQVKKWVEDSLVWSDVYTKKPEEFLEMVANGETPKWDKENKKWISASQSEIVIGGDSAGDSAGEPMPEDPQANDDPEEDLPF